MHDTPNWENGEEQMLKNMIIYSYTSLSLPFGLTWVRLYVEIYGIGTGNFQHLDQREVDIED